MADEKFTRQVPFFRLLVPYISGIVMGLSFGIPFSQLHLSLLLVVLFLLYMASLFFSSKWQHRWVTGVVVMAFLFLAGIVCTSNHKGSSVIKEGKNQEVIIRLLEPVEERASNYRTLGEVEWQRIDNVWIPIGERVMLYFSSKDTLMATLRYGSIVAARSSFSAIPEALNPYQFDYRDYLAKKGIYRTAFIQSGEWLVTGIDVNPLISFAYRLRGILLNLYESVGIGGGNLAVLSALTMGYKSLLDDETKRVFSTSGAMHILAVSGLHVGIFYATISAFLFFLGRIRRGRVVKSFIIIGLLWFFAIFTGFSPSVIRATLMFTLVVAGTAFSRKTNIYNTLSASAFVILAINPMLITEVGFLLSYFAVMSIVFFYPHIYGLLYVKNRWLDKIWALVAVSAAAQIGTFAISIYYFHQFPNYFIFTNLYAIPLASIVLYLSVGLILVAPLPFVAAGVGWLLDKTLLVLNMLVKFTDSLPHSVTTGLSITPSQTVVVILAVVLLAVFLESKRYAVQMGFFICVLLFFVENGYSHIQRDRQQEMVVFCVKQKSVIGFTRGEVFTLLHDGLSENPWDQYAFNLEGYMNKKGLFRGKKMTHIGFENASDGYDNGLSVLNSRYGLWVSFAGSSIFIPIGNSLNDMNAANPMAVDLLLISNKSKADLAKILQLFHPKQIVIDSSIPPWKHDDIAYLLLQKGIPFHFVEKQGAFILNMENDAKKT